MQKPSDLHSYYFMDSKVMVYKKSGELHAGPLIAFQHKKSFATLTTTRNQTTYLHYATSKITYPSVTSLKVKDLDPS